MQRDAVPQAHRSALLDQVKSRHHPLLSILPGAHVLGTDTKGSPVSAKVGQALCNLVAGGRIELPT